VATYPEVPPPSNGIDFGFPIPKDNSILPDLAASLASLNAGSLTLDCAYLRHLGSQRWGRRRE